MNIKLSRAQREILRLMAQDGWTLRLRYYWGGNRLHDGTQDAAPFTRVAVPTIIALERLELIEIIGVEHGGNPPARRGTIYAITDAGRAALKANE